MIREKILLNLERACLPTTPDEERRRLLSFVICGGGPTGVEFAAEVYDLLNEDLTRYFPKILRNEVSVHLIQSRGHILNTYDEALSVYAEVSTTQPKAHTLLAKADLRCCSGPLRARASRRSDQLSSQGDSRRQDSLHAERRAR